MSLSAVIPLPQAQADIRQTLESLLVQEVPFHEVVIAAQAGSGARVAVSAFADRFAGRLRCVEAPDALCPVDLWNFAVSSAAGEWVSLLTPQVTVRPNFVQALQASIDRCPTAGVVRAGWTRERVGGATAEQHTLLSVRTVTHPAEALYEQRFGPKASTAAAAVRRGIWEHMGGIPQEITLLGNWIGDWALWLCAGSCADTVRSPEIIADIHAGPVQVEKADEVLEMYLVYRDILPRAARSAHLAEPTWIAAASRKRFRDVTIAASNELRPVQGKERTDLALALEPWAKSVEQEALLNRFRSGEKIRSFALGQKIRPALRRVVAVVR